MKIRVCAIILAGLMLVGCGRGSLPSDDAQDSTAWINEPQTAAPVEMEAHFSDRDRSGEYDAASAILIELQGSTAVCTSKAVQIAQESDLVRKYVPGTCLRAYTRRTSR